jgi:putative DNA primase/helicase
VTAADRSRPASPAELQRLSDAEGRAWVGPTTADQEPDDETAFAADAEVLLQLAQMPPLEYDRVREIEAKRLGIRRSTLDKEIDRHRSDGKAEAGPGLLDDPVAWPHAVNGAGLLDLLAGTIRKHVVAPPLAPEALALWIMHTHAHDAWTISPLLAATSPTPECGKTTLLTLIGALVPRPLPASNITAAALFRAVEKWRPTLVIDEADTRAFLALPIRRLPSIGPGALFQKPSVYPRCFGEQWPISCWARHRRGRERTALEKRRPATALE